MLLRLALAGAVVLAVAAIGGCSGASPELAKCKASADDDDKLQARLAACSALIGHGAKGDTLEQALAGRGQAYRLSSDDAHALVDLDQALRLDPQDSAALNDRGLAYVDDDKTDLALADFNAAIRADPENGAAYDDRGYVERTRGDYDTAIIDESHAIELEPQAALPWANRGYDYAGKHQWDSAIADFNDALRIATEWNFALQGRAESERGKGDFKAALKDFYAVLGDPHGENAMDDAQAVIELSPPGDPEALNVRCWVRGVLDTDLPAALADCQQSLAARPNSAETLDSLAFIYFRQSRFDDAAREYTAALAADPKQVQSQFMRGIAELRAGDKSGGEADIAAATSANKDIAGQYAGWGVKP